MKKNRGISKTLTLVFIMAGAMISLNQRMPLAQVAEPKSPDIIAKTPRPLANAAVLLQERYGKPVTYEDPILKSNQDVELNERGNGLLPKSRSFSLPAEARPDQTPQLDALLLNRVLDAYHASNDGPRFKALSSGWGLHIVPDLVPDQSGQLVKAVSLLDTYITVPEAKRTPSEHFEALCNAVTASNSLGIRLMPFSLWLDQYFSPNGILPPRDMTQADRDRISFQWGADHVTAREAVIELLEHSSTTLTWKVLCQAGEDFCGFNLLNMRVSVAGPDGQPQKKAVFFDRCKKCPTIPTWQPGLTEK
jgi:hypothetical protein